MKLSQISLLLILVFCSNSFAQTQAPFVSANLDKVNIQSQLDGENGENLSFVTATVVYKNGNPCPNASNRLFFEVKGVGK